MLKSLNMCGNFLLFAAVLSAAFLLTTSAKTVIFYPPPIPSYVVYQTQIASELANSYNYEVWICVPHFMIKDNLVKDKKVKVFEYGEHLGDMSTSLHETTMEKFWAGEPLQDVRNLYKVSKQFMKTSDEILSNENFVERIRKLKPDLIVLESIPFNLNMLVLPYSLDVPYALIGTMHDITLSRVPFSPGAPVIFADKLSDKMSFFDRLKCVLVYIAAVNFDIFYDSNFVSKFAPHKPYKSIREIAANAEIFIAEVDHILDYPRTTLPNTKLIGGSAAHQAKPLEEKFKTFADKSRNGLIVFTFGGSVHHIPDHITSKFFAAFKQLDLNVIWGIDIPSPDPDRIMTSKWIPQNDLLGHEKTKLFISHCGKNGQYEALYHGVPILCLPIFGDQGYNAERIVVKGLGLRADIREVDAKELAAIIRQIVYEGNYTENMKKASRLYRELYKVPKKEAAYWFDHVIKFGGAYMKSTGQQMPLYQLYMLDVLAFLFVVTFTFILISVCVIFCCCRCWTSKNVKVKAKKH